MNPAVLRLLDANANRAREALRVLEDYARFVLDSREVSAGLKSLRHDLAEALQDVLPQAILHRDTPGDVGTANKVQSEWRREGMEDVVTAAGKRLGEALRAIEEYLKTISPAASANIEQLRYRFYDIEQRLARTLRPARLFSEVRLYVLVTERCCRRPWLQVAEEVLAGGADCLQLREKQLEGGELLRRARDLVALCRRYHKLCIINDRPDIAILSGADGVHVGQDDLPAIEARKLIGPDKILGVSTHRIDQARQAVLDGADYIGVGPIFQSGTKPRDFVAGLEYARQVASEIPIPAVGIAGISATNVDEVLATGIRAVAVTAAVLDSDDPKGATETLRESLRLTSSRWGRHSCLPPTQQVGQTFLSASDRRSESGGANMPVCSEPKLEKTRRRLPHWRLDGSTYFVTFRVAQGELPPPERKIVLDHLKSGATSYYTLVAATGMPDHVHVLLTPRSGTDLSRILKGVKGVSARLLNQSRSTHGHIWQDESWDRILRDQNELDEKLEYMLLNPVRKGLVEDPWEYDGWYYNEKWEQQLSQ